jgi:hypothetical protein
MNYMTSKMGKFGISSLFAVVCAAGLMSGPASATVIGAATNPNRQSVQAVCPDAPAPSAAALDLSANAGVQCEVNFVTPAGVFTQVVITLNAECAIGGATTTWLDVNIIISSAQGRGPASPSNSDNALCSGNGTFTVNDGWVSAVTQVVVSVPGGVHRVSVNVTPFPAGTPWRIDDLSLVIER